MHHALGQALLDEAIALQVLFGRAFPSKLLLVTAPNGRLAPTFVSRNLSSLKVPSQDTACLS
jgi:hypothetical protein